MIQRKSKKSRIRICYSDQEIKRTYVYSLKLTELYQPTLGTAIKVPVAIIIISNKEDIEQFRGLLSTIYTNFFLSDTKLGKYFNDDSSMNSKFDND